MAPGVRVDAKVNAWSLKVGDAWKSSSTVACVVNSWWTYQAGPKWPSATTARAPAFSQPAAMLSTRCLAWLRVGLGLPDSLFPEA